MIVSMISSTNARQFAASTLALFVAGACTSAPPPANPGPAPAPAEATRAAEPTTPAPTLSAPAQSPKVVLTFATGLALPESAIYDPIGDTYLVSNINGDPLAKDNNGYVSRLSPEGSVIDLKWIEGGQRGATLNAPKGLALANGNLYVADIDEVRVFDAKRGEPVGSIPLKGATFLNDLASLPNGDVLATDSGLKAGTKGFEPTGTDAIYRINARHQASVVKKDPAFGHPNGVVANGEALHVVNFGSAQLVSINSDGTQTTTPMPKATLDGVIAIGSDLVVSCWDGKAIYRGTPGGAFREIISGLNSPADLGLDTRRGRLLVPLVFENEVRVYTLE